MLTLQQQLNLIGTCRDGCVWASKYKQPLVAWRACDRGDWLLWLAVKLGVNRADVVLAASECAMLVLDYMMDERSRRGLNLATQWAGGNPQPSLEMLRDAAPPAYDAFIDMTPGQTTAYAAAYAAYEVTALPNATFSAPNIASMAVYQVALSLSAAGRMNLSGVLAKCANIVRAQLDEQEVLALWVDCVAKM